MSQKDVKRGRKRAEPDMAKLEVAKVRSDNKLVEELEMLQEKLQKLGHYNRSYDSMLQDVRMAHHKQKHIERLIEGDMKRSFNLSRAALVFAAAFVFIASFYYFLKNPTVTGHAVDGITKVATNQVFSTAMGMLVVIAIMGVILHGAEHRHKHRHDKYKHPKMLE